MARRRTPLGLALLLAALGCASGPASERTVLVGTSAEVFVLLPLNVASVMPDELKRAGPLVFREIRAYLEAQGVRLKTVAHAEARQLWLASIQEARAGPGGARAGFEEAARIFVGKLAAHAEFDSVVMPSLFVQGASVSGLTASWDGVERAIEIEEGRWADTVTEETLLVGLVGAASLHVAILDARGNKVQEGQSGLVLLSRIRVQGPPTALSGEQSFSLVPHPAPFSRRTEVWRGVARALAPFLPPMDPPGTD